MDDKRNKDEIPQLKPTSRDILSYPLILGKPGVGKTVAYWRSQNVDDISNPLSKYSYNEFLKMNEEAKKYSKKNETHIGDIIGFECICSHITKHTLIAERLPIKLIINSVAEKKTYVINPEELKDWIGFAEE